MRRVVATSDVTRFRGVAIAAIAAAAVAAIATVMLWSGTTSPGPLSASHRAAGVGCATCHTRGTDEAPPASACASCHGEHATARPGHAALRADATLACSGCHGGHRDHGTVTFFPDGTALRRDDAGDRPVGLVHPARRREAPASTDAVAAAPVRPERRRESPASTDAVSFRPARAVTVPLLAAARCARCHDAARAPLATCTSAGVVTCFDEHTPIRARDGAIAARAAAWDAARAVAAAMPPRPRSPDRSTSPWLVLAFSAFTAVVAWSAARAIAARRFSSTPGADVATSALRGPRPSSRGPLPEARGPTAQAPVPRADAARALRRLPTIEASTCLGCNACVEACPYDVLEVRRYVAVVARPDACCGLTLCAQSCPNQSLTMRDLGGDVAAIPVRRGLEALDAPGVFLVGDAGGGSLIRNAVDEGARAVAELAARPRPPVSDADLLDVLVVGAGPAGLAAALEARARGLRALTLEQGTIASSIQSFPRGKLVLDAAPAGATPPRLWLAETTKEDLLARWTLAIRTEQPPILERHRVTALDPAPDGTWRVTSADAAGARVTHRARAVVVAIGRRGSPRRLAVDVPAAMAAHVHYALADAASFAGRRVVIVGAGDVAMETAIALSRQPGTDVVVSYRGAELRRGRARNLAELRRRIAAGAVRVVWSSEVTAVDPGAVTLGTPSGPMHVPCDSLFVMIGSEAAPDGSDLLSRLTPTLRARQTDPPHHAFDTR